MKNKLMLFLIIGLIFGLTDIVDYTLILVDSATFGMTGTNYAFISDLMPLTGYSFILVNAILGIIYVIASISSIILLKSGERKRMLFFLILVNIINILGLIGIIKKYGATDLICLKYYVTAIVYIVVIIFSAKIVDKVELMNIEDKIINLLIILILIFAYVQPILKLTVYIKNGLYTHPADYELILANLIEISDEWVLRRLVSQLLIVLPIICLLSNYKNHKVEIVSANILLVVSILGVISIFAKYDDFWDISYDTYLAIIFSIILAGYIIYKNFIDKPNSLDIKYNISNSNSDSNKNELNNNGIKNYNINDIKDADFKYCQKCGRKVFDDSEFCSNCGTKQDSIKIANPNEENDVCDQENNQRSNVTPSNQTDNVTTSNNKTKKISKKTLPIIIVVVAVLAIALVTVMSNVKKYTLFSIIWNDDDYDTVYGQKYGGEWYGEATVKGKKIEFSAGVYDDKLEYSCELPVKISEDLIYCTCSLVQNDVLMGEISHVAMFIDPDGELIIGMNDAAIMVYK